MAKLVSMSLYRRTETHNTFAALARPWALSEPGRSRVRSGNLPLAAVKSERKLTNDEIARLREGIALLRSTAGAETGVAR